MKIYTGPHGGKHERQMIMQYNMGMMLAPHTHISKSFNEIQYLALDNGAFAAYQKGYPFDEYKFLKTLSNCIKHDLILDFIVIPDIVGGGKSSLDFSAQWIDRMHCDKLALVVNKDVTTKDVVPFLMDIKCIFVSGRFDERWQYWSDFAHEHGKICHIGSAGTINRLRYAKQCGVDSVDSTSIVRNKYWHVLEEFYNPAQKQPEFKWDE